MKTAETLCGFSLTDTRHGETLGDYVARLNAVYGRNLVGFWSESDVVDGWLDARDVDDLAGDIAMAGERRRANRNV